MNEVDTEGLRSYAYIYTGRCFYGVTFYADSEFEFNEALRRVILKVIQNNDHTG